MKAKSRSAIILSAPVLVAASSLNAATYFNLNFDNVTAQTYVDRFGTGLLRPEMVESWNAAGGMTKMTDADGAGFPWSGQQVVAANAGSNGFGSQSFAATYHTGGDAGAVRLGTTTGNFFTGTNTGQYEFTYDVSVNTIAAGWEFLPTLHLLGSTGTQAYNNGNATSTYDGAALLSIVIDNGLIRALGGSNTNLTLVESASEDTPYSIKAILDMDANTVAYSVNNVSIGTLNQLQAADPARGIMGMGYSPGRLPGLEGVSAYYDNFKLESPASPSGFYWDNTGGNANDWGAVANWSTVVGGGTNPAAIPGATAVATFSATPIQGTAQTVNLNADRSLLGLDFLAGVTASTTLLGGGTNRVLTLGTSGILKAGTGAVTIGSASSGQQVAIALGADQTWANNHNTGAISILNGVTSNAAGARILTLDGTSTATNTVSGIIGNGSGTVAVTKTGAGLWQLSGANTYTGATTISAGTLELSGGSAIANTGAVSIGNVSGATLKLNASETIGSLAGGGGTGGAVNLQANTLTTGDASTTTFAGIISGTGALTKQGAGTFTLSGANTYTGATTISAGTLELSGGSAIANTGAVSIDNVSGATLKLNASETIGSLAGGGGTGGAVNLQANTLTTGDASNTTFAGIISGTGALTKQGAGTFTLSGANTYTGVTTISAGTLQIGNGGTTGSLGTGNVEIQSGATIAFNRSDTITSVNGGIPAFSGAGTLVQRGTGMLGLRNNNSELTGGIRVEQGTLEFGNNNNNIGTGTLTLGVNGGTGAVRALVNDNFSATFSNAIVLAAGHTGSLTIEMTAEAAPIPGLSKTFTGGITGTNNLTIRNNSGAENLNFNTGAINHTGTITFAGTATTGLTTINAAIGSNVTSLTQNGTATLVLAGTNTYTGNTTINAGTLALSSTGSIASSDTIDVKSGATFDVSEKSGYTVGASQTLTGSGTVAGDTAISGTLAPGNSPGTLDFTGDLTFNAASIFEWELDATDGADPGVVANSGTYDRVIATGDLTGSGAVFEVVLGSNDFSDAFWDSDKTWTNIFTANNSFDLASIFTSFSGAGVDSSGAVSGEGSFSLSGNTLSWAVIPELGNAAAGLLLAAGLLRRRRPAGLATTPPRNELDGSQPRLVRDLDPDSRRR